MSDVNGGGIIALVLFYLLILGIGLFAAWKRNKNAKKATSVEEETNEVILAGRSIGGIIGCFTMTGKRLVDKKWLNIYRKLRVHLLGKIFDTLLKDQRKKPS